MRNTRLLAAGLGTAFALVAALLVNTAPAGEPTAMGVLWGSVFGTLAILSWLFALAVPPGQRQ